MQLLEADRVITAKGLLTNGAVLVDGKTVTWVGHRDAIDPAQREAAEATDLGHATLLPGLIDCHVHLGFDGSAEPVQHMKQSSNPDQLVQMLHSAGELLSAGVTTARDLGARDFLDVTVRSAIESGLARGPRMLVANRPITVTGGHCWFMGGECDGVDAIRRLVRTHHKAGADLIKVMATGGYMTDGSVPWRAQFTGHELRALVDEAHRLDKLVAAHAHGTAGIRNAVAAGVDTIEHGSWWGPDRTDEYDPQVADTIAEAGIYVCPTMSARAKSLGEELWQSRAKRIQRMHDQGVQFIAGTDAGINLLPHRDYAIGLELLVESGLGAAEVIQAATSRAARALGLESVTGTLAPGMTADLIAVDGDPLADISVLRTPLLVMSRGLIDTVSLRVPTMREQARP